MRLSFIVGSSDYVIDAQDRYTIVNKDCGSEGYNPIGDSINISRDDHISSYSSAYTSKYLLTNLIYDILIEMFCESVRGNIFIGRNTKTLSEWGISEIISDFGSDVSEQIVRISRISFYTDITEDQAEHIYKSMNTIGKFCLNYKTKNKQYMVLDRASHTDFTEMEFEDIWKFVIKYTAAPICNVFNVLKLIFNDICGYPLTQFGKLIEKYVSKHVGYGDHKKLFATHRVATHLFTSGRVNTQATDNLVDLFFIVKIFYKTLGGTLKESSRFNYILKTFLNNKLPLIPEYKVLDSIQFTDGVISTINRLFEMGHMSQEDHQLYSSTILKYSLI